jgi:HEAT repeat protein
MLWSFGPQARAALPEVAAGLDDYYWPSRAAAAATLGKIGPAAKDAAPALARLLHDNEQRVRAIAALALYQVTGDAAPAVQSLERLLADDIELAAREEAARYLGQIGPAARAAIPSLEYCLTSEDPALQRSALEALQRVQPPKR